MKSLENELKASDSLTTKKEISLSKKQKDLTSLSVQENIAELKLCSVETFKGLFQYLDIPKYKLDLIKKMNQFRDEIGKIKMSNYRDKRKSNEIFVCCFMYNSSNPDKRGNVNLTKHT